ncbi:MAG: hypothetical protein M3Y48_09195 [Actinomycetota bacterium]|nr:hypothetical protein [Actinomycetota bacterium]
MDVKIAGALIAAGASLIIAIITAIESRINIRRVHVLQAQLEQQKRILAGELESQKLYLANELEERRAVRDARRDYEYDARRRLYEQCEPLLFQAMEFAEVASSRIISLAQSARRQDIKADGSGWLARPGYYFQSTVFMLLAPLTTTKILQMRLTTVDLSLEPRLQLQYKLLKSIYQSFASDFQLAARDPALPYDPDRADPDKSDHERLLRETPEVYRRQGLYFGTLEVLAESMLDQGRTRCKSFGEFMADWNSSKTKINDLIPDIMALFEGFHPGRHPVLWRVLVSQFLQYRLFLNIQRQGAQEKNQVQGLIQIPQDAVLSRFDWRSAQNEANESAVREPFEIAHAYLLGTVDDMQDNLVER